MFSRDFTFYFIIDGYKVIQKSFKAFSRKRALMKAIRQLPKCNYFSVYDGSYKPKSVFKKILMPNGSYSIMMDKIAFHRALKAANNSISGKKNEPNR